MQLNVFIAFNNMNKRSKIFHYFLLGMILCIFIGFLTSFNKEEKYVNRADQKINVLITSWVQFYLTLESQDYNAFPPTSSDQIFKINLAAYVAQKIASDRYTLDCAEVYELLDYVYATQMKNTYRNHPQILQKILLRQGQKDHNKSEIIIEIATMSSEIVESYNNKSSALPFAATEATQYNNDVLKFDQKNGILPNWGTRNTCVASLNSCIVNLPYFGMDRQSGIHKDAMTVYSISKGLSKEDQWIAEFWSDDLRGLTYSPVSRWFSIGIQMIQKENVTYPESLKLLARMAIGLHDATIICWHEKYKHNIARPEKYIQAYIDADWKPFHETPNFPSYPSGHAVLSSAAGQILESYFGKKYSFTDRSHIHRTEFYGSERSFNTIREMAIENAYSRILMGVHFPEDCEAGLKLGIQVGDIIIKNGEKSISSKIEAKMNDVYCSIKT